MPKQLDELKKLAAIAADLGLSAGIRKEAIGQMGSIGSRDALLALLELAGNAALGRQERELALKQAGEILKSGR